MMQQSVSKAIALFAVFLLIVPPGLFAQEQTAQKTFKQEELDQLLAPIALYPDELLSQIFMASTYPLEVVEADRWVKQNKDLNGDDLTAALESQSWDPSVKSLVNFPQVLDMMNNQLEWTQNLGDAFLAQQKDVLDTVQQLRQKADKQGNLNSSEQQTVVVEKETQTIVIQPADPQVIYVPTYNPTVIYGPWWYPAYPPYYYHPPGYVAGGAIISFGVGMAIGAAWGYAWGGCNWRRGHVDIDINKNININRNINRARYKNDLSINANGRGAWKHNPSHRKGVAYRDQTTAKKFNKGMDRSAQAREAYRGRADAGRKQLQGQKGLHSGRPAQTGRADKHGLSDASRTRDGGGIKSQSSSRQRNQTTKDRSATGRSAFGGYDSGQRVQHFSNRGHHSLSGSQFSGGMRGRGAHGGARRTR